MTRIAVLPWIILIGSTVPAIAQVRPEPGQGNPHLQTVDYHADQVVLLETAPGYQLTVGLAADEQIESVAVGDSVSWQISASNDRNHLFIKALHPDASTNMTVVTTTRLYAFDLVALTGPSLSMPYTVQFHYPVHDRSSDVQGPSSPGPVVGRYELHGDHALRPSGIMDDGVHTYIEWSADTALPATYVRDENDVETLANGEMRDGLYVVDGVHDRLIFRIGKDSARADRLPPENPQ
jgi:type IV secretion system protein VirB9